jgi:hypothetical protein
VSAESVGLILSGATLVVIAATAIAAIVQLRHLRASNQVNAFFAIMSQWNSEALQAAYATFLRELPNKLADPKYVKRLKDPSQRLDRASNQEFLIFDFWEQVGTFAKRGLIDETILLDIVSAQVLGAWQAGEPVITIVRERTGLATFENFEYLAVRAAFWQKHFPDGTYPSRLPRMSDLAKRSDP